MLYGLEKQPRIPALHASEKGIGDGGKRICIIVFRAAEQERGHHCIEPERPATYQMLDLGVCRIRKRNLPEANIAAGAFVLVLTQFVQQRPASALVREENVQQGTVCLP